MVGDMRMRNQYMTTDEKVFYSFIIVLLVVLCVIVLYPIIYIVSASFSDPVAVMKNEIVLLPKNPTLIGYKKIFAKDEIWTSYRNTVLYTLVGTTINIIMTSLGAYPLSRRDFHLKGVWMGLITFTMFFSGGMIPSYLLIKNLKLLDTFWVMVIPGAISTWNLIIMRTFFQNDIPRELEEAAIIDGCNDWQIFYRIVIPLSAPIIAVMVMFYGVGHWNSFFGALLYLNDRKKYPLQLILREVLIQNIVSEDMVSGPAADQQVVGESIRYSLIIVATLPILLVYPFIQQYFVKGVMIGAIKG